MVDPQGTITTSKQKHTTPPQMETDVEEQKFHGSEKMLKGV